jgi:hypothetical protein
MTKYRLKSLSINAEPFRCGESRGLRRKIIDCDCNRKRGIEMEMEDGKSTVRIDCRYAVPSICRPWVYANAKHAVGYADDCCHHPWKPPNLLASEALFVFLNLSFCDCVHYSLLNIWIILCRWRARVGCCAVSTRATRI